MGTPFTASLPFAALSQDRRIVAKNTRQEYAVPSKTVTQLQARWTRDIIWGV